MKNNCISSFSWVVVLICCAIIIVFIVVEIPFDVFSSADNNIFEEGDARGSDMDIDILIFYLGYGSSYWAIDNTLVLCEDSSGDWMNLTWQQKLSVFNEEEYGEFNRIYTIIKLWEAEMYGKE